jgi:hypothetical protein
MRCIMYWVVESISTNDVALITSPRLFFYRALHVLCLLIFFLPTLTLIHSSLSLSLIIHLSHPPL